MIRISDLLIWLPLWQNVNECFHRTSLLYHYDERKMKHGNAKWEIFGDLSSPFLYLLAEHLGFSKELAAKRKLSLCTLSFLANPLGTSGCFFICLHVILCLIVY